MVTDSSIYKSSWKGRMIKKYEVQHGRRIINCANITQIVTIIDQSVTALFLFQKDY